MGNLLVVAQPTPQQLTDYSNALLTINNYAYGITNQQMPVLNSPPPNYASFVSDFAPAKQHALNWSDNIFVSMVQLPSTIKNQAANLFSMEQTFIEAYLNALITDPSNATAKAGLQSALGTVVTLIGNQTTTIGNIQTELTTFGANILADASILTTISNNALTDAGDDQTKITNLTTDIESLKSQISAAQTLLTVSEIGLGVSIFVGIVGAVCCFIPGGQGIGVGLIVVGVVGLGASIAGTIIEQKEIDALQGQIASEQTQITGLHQDIIMLTNLSNQFNDLYTANLKAQSALTTINSMWTNLSGAVTNVSTELTDVNNDVTATHYADALNDFRAAEANWNDVVTFADALAGINYSWEDAGGNMHNYATQSPAADSGKLYQIPSGSAAISSFEATLKSAL